MENVKETWIVSEPEKCKCGICTLYDIIADSMYDKTFDHYDCTKVEVGKEIQNMVEEYYIENGVDRQTFCMKWCCWGPKATLEGYEVRVEDGWAYDDEEEV